MGQNYTQEQTKQADNIEQSQNTSAKQKGKLNSCQTCGQPIAKSAKVCPHCGAKIKKPIYKKGWFIAICTLLVLGIIGSANNDRTDKSSKNNDNNFVEVKSDGDDNSDNSNDNNDENIVSNRFVPGDTVDIDGFNVSYDNCETDWKGYNQYAKPSDGNKIIRAYFTFTNNSNGDRTCGSASFSCYADGVSCTPYWLGDDALSTIDTLSPSRILKGWVYFEVPQNAEAIELEYGIDYFTSDHIIFEVQ